MIEGQLVTRNIAQKGFRDMQSSLLTSISVRLDSDVLCIPFQAILPTLAIIMTLSRILPKLI